jgi:6-bladed beta-propeller
MGRTDVRSGTAVRLILGFLFLPAHSEAQRAPPDPSAPASFELLSVVGDDPAREEAVFGKVGSIALSGAGEVFVLDNMAMAVRVFDGRTGEYLRSLGGPGEGPGEFQRPLTVTVEGDRVVRVLDGATGRVSSFSLQGALLDDRTLTRGSHAFLAEARLSRRGRVFGATFPRTSPERDRTELRQFVVSIDASGAVDTLSSFHSWIGTWSSARSPAGTNELGWSPLPIGRDMIDEAHRWLFKLYANVGKGPPRRVEFHLPPRRSNSDRMFFSRGGDLRRVTRKPPRRFS